MGSSSEDSESESLLRVRDFDVDAVPVSDRPTRSRALKSSGMSFQCRSRRTMIEVNGRRARLHQLDVIGTDGLARASEAGGNMLYYYLGYLLSLRGNSCK